MKLWMAESRRVAAALLYLQATTLAGAIRLRLKRLKQPKYLLGAIVLVAYFGLVIGGKAWELGHSPAKLFVEKSLDAIAWVTALGYFIWVVFSWLFPGGRTTLRFSESEIAFLFPAPLTRVGLINFSLLRAQLPIFLSAFLLSVVFGRGRGLPGNSLQHATAIWLAIATLRLHTLGASFTIERFVERGEMRWLRRAVVPAIVLLLLASILAWVVASSPPAPSISGEGGGKALLLWLDARLHAAPLAYLLAPFRWLAAPLVSGASGWWLSLLPVLALLLAHYLWVVRANVAFEEASIAVAARRALQAENIRTGKWPWGSGKRKASNEPFRLAEKGPPELAFLWSGLLGAGGGFWRPRVVVAILVATLALIFGIAASPWAWSLDAIAGFGAIVAMVFVFLGAMFMQGRLRDILDMLDIYKSGPLSGRQIALGQLLTPAALASFAQWYGLFIAMAAMLAGGHADAGALAYGWSGAFAAALLGPLLCIILLSIPFAWILWFPAWAASLGTRGGGFEAAGQRMIFAFVYMFAAAVALLPALILGGLVAWMASLLGLPASLSLVIVALVAAVLMVLEIAAIVYTLGGRIDRFDVATELR